MVVERVSKSWCLLKSERIWCPDAQYWERFTCPCLQTYALWCVWSFCEDQLFVLSFRAVIQDSSAGLQSLYSLWWSESLRLCDICNSICNNHGKPARQKDELMCGVNYRSCDSNWFLVPGVYRGLAGRHLIQTGNQCLYGVFSILLFTTYFDVFLVFLLIHFCLFFYSSYFLSFLQMCLYLFSLLRYICFLFLQFLVILFFGITILYIYIFFSSNSVHVRLRVYRLYDSQICWVAPVGNEGCPGAHCYWEGEHPNIHDICSWSICAFSVRPRILFILIRFTSGFLSFLLMPTLAR